jgi:hypothetical protein
MDKQDLIKILVIVVAVSFLTEIFAFRGDIPFLNFGPPKEAKNLTGITVFNGSIRTYDPYLVIPAATSKDIIDMLKGKEGVKTVQLKTEGYVVETETRDDVFPLSNYLLTQNVSSQTVANIVVPQTLVVATSAGNKNASAAGIVRVATEPLLDVDSPVTVQMTAIISDAGELLDYRAATIIKQTLEADFDARIIRMNGKSYSYTIPWENRTMVGDLSAFGKVDYKPVDSIVFTAPLTTPQVLAKKLFPYIVYIDTGSALVEPGFSDATQVALNFADVNYTLPPSKLTVYTNSSDAPLPDFDAAMLYRYEIEMDASGFDFGSAPLVLSTSKEFSQGQTVKVRISAVALGNKIILIRSVSIPS